MALATRLNLEVCTPEKKAVAGAEVEGVIIPGELGQMNVLPGHVSLVTNLKAGTFAYRPNGEWSWAVLSGGFAQVGDGKVTILAETMEMATEIDKARAANALKKAEESLKELEFGTAAHEDAWSAQERAKARIETSEKHN